MARCIFFLKIEAFDARNTIFTTELPNYRITCLHLYGEEGVIGLIQDFQSLRKHSKKNLLRFNRVKTPLNSV